MTNASGQSPPPGAPQDSATPGSTSASSLVAGGEPISVAGPPAHQRYLEVVDSVNQVLFRTDGEGRLVFLNDYWSELSGFAIDQSRMRSLCDFLHPDDRARARDALRGLLRDEADAWSGELRLRTHAGEIRWIGVDCRRVLDRDGGGTWIAGTLDDISSRKVAELSLRNLNQELEARVRARTAELEAANSELEAFSYSVSHDLRAPLRAIDGFARILAEEAGERLETHEREHLARIRSAAERMAVLIDAMIDLASVTRQPLQRETVDLSKLAEAVIRELHAESPEREVAVEITRDLVVNADPALMHVLLDNLLRNAWKFTSRTPDARIRFGARREGGRIVFQVEDNGAGFDMHYANKLFKPFQRLHAQHEFPGTGIGLATIHRIVGRHDGRIWVDAQPGAGARFSFVLGQ
ncbi:MAG TPA: PAS domain-containing sensor histidine kinase [Thauera sp.]|nr:PAS domain-containing sensor histidine kinase [Thauera sp.]HHW63676.1 PAS domain S-box protein [Rhodocyclaceae bacterium]